MKYLILYMLLAFGNLLQAQSLFPSTTNPKSVDQPNLDAIDDLFGPIVPHNIIKYYSGQDGNLTLQETAQVTYQNNIIDTAIVYDSTGAIWKYLSTDMQIVDSFSIIRYSNTQVQEWNTPVLIFNNNDTVYKYYEVATGPGFIAVGMDYDTLGRLFRYSTNTIQGFTESHIYYSAQNTYWDSLVNVLPDLPALVTTFYPIYNNGVLDSTVSTQNYTNPVLYPGIPAHRVLRNAQGELLEITITDRWGWEYKWEFLNGTIGLTEIENNEQKELIKIVDLMGRETNYQTNTPLIYVYSDGSTEKVYVVD